MMIARLCLLLALLMPVPAALAQSTTDTAFDSAIAAFEKAYARLGRDSFGVDVAAYRDALTLRRFTSSHWGGTVTLSVATPATSDGACSRYAAYVAMPPQNGRLSLVLCPQFRNEGNGALRRLTVLHEMVHVVAGPDECRAMAFAARVEQIATGQHTPVDRYWQANGCAGGPFSLP